jgi:hypothetical protein
VLERVFKKLSPGSAKLFGKLGSEMLHQRLRRIEDVAPWLSITPLFADKDGHRAMGQNTGRLAAKKQAFQPAPTVRGHDDKVGSELVQCGHFPQAAVRRLMVTQHEHAEHFDNTFAVR